MRDERIWSIINKLVFKMATSVAGPKQSLREANQFLSLLKEGTCFWQEDEKYPKNMMPKYSLKLDKKIILPTGI
jgi:hypothetical protein